MINQLIRWLLLCILVVSCLSLLVVYQFHDYIGEVHSARALPLAVVIGLTSIAVAIYEKQK
ncbi:hypothetical protein EDM54_04440 [Brevibacillus borstelensis]|jgi:hypothetical protein|nr:hypothetical protein X546_01285 [Brevibacillus borstelensis cifa_chp40]RNB65168.1 hypothetical protein EDM54_04440 [Brevibacillus borstelensis]GED53246.1 hypothetical protein BBO01nite_24870 [Brevibacillus borstelensis]